MPIRLCWCHDRAAYITSGSIQDALCAKHAREVASTVKVERLFQDGDRLVPLLRAWAIA